MALVEKWKKRDNYVSRAQLREQLDRHTRAPFLDTLAALLNCRPTMENIIQWASQHPDRWANAIAVFAKLGGYTEKMEVQLDVFHNITDLSDAALLQQLQELQSNYNLVNKPVALIPADNSVTTINQPSQEKDTKKG